MMYNVSKTELLRMRKNLVLQTVVPILENKGFVKAPFSSSNYGYVNSHIYIYEMCRLVDNQYLEFVSVSLSREDKYIKVHINVFELSPPIGDLSLLKQIDGINYWIPPNSEKQMRIDLDFIKIPPIISWDFWFKDFKLKFYFTREGYQKRVNQLTTLLKIKIGNIDSYFREWHQYHHPNITKWDGCVICQT